jgi:hypothetical protein
MINSGVCGRLLVDPTEGEENLWAALEVGWHLKDAPPPRRESDEDETHEDEAYARRRSQ